MESTDPITPGVGPKPAILCLHGYGTNGEIFRHQLRTLAPSLSEFHLLLPTAPLPVSAPGSGASPLSSPSPHSAPTAAGTRTRPSRVLLDEKLVVRALLAETIAAARAAGHDVGEEGLGRGVGFAVVVCGCFAPLTLRVG
ncbi:hypothetical protein B0T18DRAFT_424736 [Schizothecium vesticola]|uniref:Serine hydrolase domain-containing protein n=1 Tax=Schizothecium vesticola TaxID=314040 RepID=A0AA40FAU0_9PEZI|nr:hypothetical protein B0T18DRAFT_424736 [Schizothecium vesticola]